MKNVIKNIIALLFLGLAAFFFRSDLESLWHKIQNNYFPCTMPIMYTLGAFDRRFGISKMEFLRDVKIAEKIWEMPIKKELFSYAPNGNSTGDLVVNLIYDKRQAATINLQKMDASIQATKESYDAMKSKYDALKLRFEQDKNVLPREELNKEIDNLNSLVDALNALATTLNLNAVQLNKISKQQGEFEEGTYYTGPEGDQISIYQFENQDKLVRVLAHELGHALGLDHVADPKAIMYRLNDGANEKLTAVDVKELKQKCGVK